MKFLQNRIPSVTDENFQLRWLKALFRFTAVTLGGLHTWAAATRYSMNPDGIAYIHMGEAYMRRDWSSALNSYWSPLYSWVLGLALHLPNPPMRWEFPLIHIVNFSVYLVTLLCFEFFWCQLRGPQQGQVTLVSGGKSLTLPGWAWLGLGYTFFIWSSLNLIKIWAVTPDMFVAAFVYLAAGIIVHIRTAAASWRTSALLGIVLGFGYLAKAAMFPMAFVFLGVSLLSVGNLRRAISLALTASVFFLLIGGPYIAVLSNAKGRFTFSDAGKLMYAWHVNGIPYPHWQGEVPGGGIPKHPSRKIFDVPPIYEFGTPIGGTYPVSYDPSYWYEGVVPHFDLRGQIRVLLSGAQIYFDLFFRQLGGLIVGLLILYVFGQRRQVRVADILRQWGLVIPAFAALGMYALVHVQSRYIGAFVVLLWADLLANVRLPDLPTSNKLMNLVSVTMILIMLINIAAFNFEGFNALISNAFRTQSVSQQALPPSWPGEVAEELHRLGIQPGGRVAIIGYGFDAFWARLARVQIVAEMLEWQAEAFWLGDSTVRSQVIEAFAHTGAKAIVAEHVPAYASLAGWHRIGDTDYYIYLVTEEAPAQLP